MYSFEGSFVMKMRSGKFYECCVFFEQLLGNIPVGSVDYHSW